MEKVTEWKVTSKGHQPQVVNSQIQEKKMIPPSCLVEGDFFFGF